MSNTTKLIIAMILFLIYGFIALYSGWIPGSARQVEEKLLESAHTNLLTQGDLSEATHSDQFSIEMDGQKAIINGIARSKEQRNQIVKTVKSARWSGGLIAGGVTVVDSKGLEIVPLPPEPDTPFIWVADKTHDALVISGMVPDESARQIILTHARGQFPEGVIDRMTVARGVPEGEWANAARRSLDTLAKLQSGRVTGDDNVFTVVGKAASLEIANLAESTLREMPLGFRGEPTIDAPEPRKLQSPYTWHAQMDAQSDPVVLSGYVPDPETATNIVDHARSLFSQRVINTMVVADGVPGNSDEWREAVKSSLTILAGLKMGHAQSTDLAFKITGTTDSENMVRNANLVMTSLGASFEGSTDIKVIAPPIIEEADKCQALFDEAMRKTTINFQTARATIAESSYELLDQLSIAAKSCSNFKISISGHTDSDGSASSNQALSERRAKAVVDYLIGSGVDVTQLTSRGYGEEKPIADNTTSAGKARNRRIEFKIEQ